MIAVAAFDRLVVARGFENTEGLLLASLIVLALAAKYEEHVAVSVTRMCKDLGLTQLENLSAEQLRMCEFEVLNLLGFKVGTTTATSFFATQAASLL